MAEFRYIESTDQPSDVNGSLGNLRTSLRLAYNTNRGSLEKLLLIKETLQQVIDRIDEGFAIELDIPEHTVPDILSIDTQDKKTPKAEEFSKANPPTRTKDK